MTNKQYFISGIGTNIGKTIISAILVEALKADYWKPIQSGDLKNSDTDKVSALVSNPISTFHPNTYAFKEAASPHYAAKLENKIIDLQEFIIPNSSKSLIVEGAGGLLVPLNNEQLLIDLIKYLDLELILVIQNYLGSINHSLLSVEACKQKQIAIKGIIFNGEINASSEDYILQYTKVPLLGRVLQEKEMNKKTILKYTKQFEFLKDDQRGNI